MSSNTKPKPSSKESPTEPFKRAVAGCLRAIARKPELEVSYAAERPGMVGGKARLPEPPRKLNAQEAAIVRGHADSIALRVACHDAAVHRRQMPSGQQGRAVEHLDVRPAAAGRGGDDVAGAVAVDVARGNMDAAAEGRAVGQEGALQAAVGVVLPDARLAGGGGHRVAAQAGPAVGSAGRHGERLREGRGVAGREVGGRGGQEPAFDPVRQPDGDLARAGNAG